ncbi:unnamed protein product [marine sediment metagenome]|uniref:Uncharacterized protein n=1 Tax=marine sediment metagenome TaxID=412755 RepID=X0V333_9ZZZZ
MKPKIIIPHSRLPVMVWEAECNKEQKKRYKKDYYIRNRVPMGETFEVRLGKAVKEFEKMGFETVEIIYRENQYKNPDYNDLFIRVDQLVERIEKLEKGMND